MIVQRVTVEERQWSMGFATERLGDYLVKQHAKRPQATIDVICLGVHGNSVLYQFIHRWREGK